VVSLFLIRGAAVLLAGMYAMRTTYAPMAGKIEPLTFLAATIFVFCLFIFHRVPQNIDWWAYLVIGGSIVGCIVNLIFFKAAPSQSVEGVISAVSTFCWVVVGASLAFSLYSSKG
jgi:hypothetical protein